MTNVLRRKPACNAKTPRRQDAKAEKAFGKSFYHEGSGVATLVAMSKIFQNTQALKYLDVFFSASFASLRLNLSLLGALGRLGALGVSTCSSWRLGVLASWRLVFGMIAVMMLAGCAAAGGGRVVPQVGSHAAATAPSKDAIAAMEVYAVPIALNWDKDPQPDGVEMRVFFFVKDKPLAQPMTRGSLRIEAFDGRLGKTSPRVRAYGGWTGKTSPSDARPLHVWTLTPADMAGRAQHGLVGTGYQLALDWDDDVPRQPFVTMVATYFPPEDHAAPVSADPVAIAVKAAP